MTTPKEPNFFSDDDIYEKGFDWYEALFSEARAGDIRGEASTHYTKLLTHPDTIPRITEAYGNDIKCIYVIRHPVDRLISHYIHEWSQNNISVDINSAVKTHPELIDYSCYFRQIKPYLDTFGKHNVQLVFYEKFVEDPKAQLARCAKFIGFDGDPSWHDDSSRENRSSERIRKFRGYELLVNNPLLAGLRRSLVPKSFREFVKQKLSMQQRPELSAASLEYLTDRFNADLSELGKLLSVRLNCDNFIQTALAKDHDWA